MNFKAVCLNFFSQEAKERVLGKEKLGDTRAETKLSKKSKPGALKRFSTINKAIEEGRRKLWKTKGFKFQFINASFVLCSMWNNASEYIICLDNLS